MLAEHERPHRGGSSGHGLMATTLPSRAHRRPRAPPVLRRGGRGRVARARRPSAARAGGAAGRRRIHRRRLSCVRRRAASSAPIGTKGTIGMSGHSKWATTKHRKGAVDAKRSALFSQADAHHHRRGQDRRRPQSREQRVARRRDRQGQELLAAQGQDRDRHRQGVRGRRRCGATTTRSSTRATGPAASRSTSRRSPTTATAPPPTSARAFTRAGGNLGSTGSVAFQFERKGEIIIEKSDVADEDELMLLVADAGGEDLEDGRRGLDRHHRTPPTSCP